MLMRTSDRSGAHYAMDAFVQAIIDLIDAKCQPLQEEIETLRAEVGALRDKSNGKRG